MNFTWADFSAFVTAALEFLKAFLSELGEWPLDLGIKADDAE